MPIGVAMALRAINEDESARGGVELQLRVGSSRFPLARLNRINYLRRVFKRAVSNVNACRVKAAQIVPPV